MLGVPMVSPTTTAAQVATLVAVDNAMAMAEFSLDGRLLHANRNYAHLFQLDVGQCLGRSHDSFCTPEWASSPAATQLWACLRAGQEFAGEMERLRSDGSICWLDAVYTPVRNTQGVVTHVLQIAFDITVRRLHAQRLSLVADVTDTAVLISDTQSRIIYVNGGFERMLGWSLQELAERSDMALLAPQQSASQQAQWRAALQAGSPLEREEVIAGKNGQHFWVKVLSNPVADATGHWRYTVSTITDITNTKMHEVLQRRVLEAMASDLPLKQVLDMVCEEVERIAPEVSASILAVDAQGVLHPLASPSLPASYTSQLEGLVIGPQVGSCGTAAWRNEAVVVHDIATDPLWTDYKADILPLGYKACWSTPIVNNAGNVAGTFAFYYRHTHAGVASHYHLQLVDACTHLCALALEREQARLRIQQLAFYDELTGLPNRSLLQVNAEQVLAFAARSGVNVAVLFVDLDRFKQINDSLGRSAGDALLCAMALRVKEVLRQSDLAGRLSGDEFAVVLPECDADHVNVVVERLQTLLGQPLKIDNTELAVSASIGVAMFPQDGGTIDALLQCADLAMCEAKSSGRGLFRFFSSDMNRLAQDRLSLENALREALKEGALHLHYQPQVEVDSGRLYGVEALARWSHPKWGDISPVRFIPLAEECGLIMDLGHWALGEACRQLAQWRSQGWEVPCVAVNLSPSNFHHFDLPAVIADILQRNALAPTDLTLELTESILLDTNPRTMQTIEQVRAMGVRLSMDDFGTGYSSLSYLRRLPVSELKLDRSFVADLESDEAARALSRAILEIGKSLGLTVVAEGVETQGQITMLRAQGYPVAQGYWFSHPLAPQAFEAWLHDKTVETATSN